MTTPPKSTVVGIRLNHDRRAWVECEAARLGVSVRGLFEGMIDEARSGETVGQAGVTKEPASSSVAMADTSTEQVTTTTDLEEPMTSTERTSVNAGASAPPLPTPIRSAPGLGLVTGIPGGLIRARVVGDRESD